MQYQCRNNYVANSEMVRTVIKLLRHRNQRMFDDHTSWSGVASLTIFFHTLSRSRYFIRVEEGCKVAL